MGTQTWAGLGSNQHQSAESQPSREHHASFATMLWEMEPWACRIDMTLCEP